jgi:hypothetical protein
VVFITQIYLPDLAYILMWALLAIELYDMHLHPLSYNDGMFIAFLPTLGFILSLLYLITLILIASFRKPNRSFYSKLAMLSAVPIVIVIFIVTIEIHK